MRNLVIAGIAALIVVAGGAGYMALTFEKPGFGVMDKGDWGKVSDSTIKVNSKIWINNPNPVGLSLGFVDLKYRAEANNITLASGTVKGLSIGTGNNTKQFTTEVRQSQIPSWWVSHLKNDEVSTITAPVTVKLPFTSFSTEAFSKKIETNLAKKIEKNLNSMEGTYEGPGIEKSRNGFTVEVRPELEIRDIQASWGNVSSDVTQTNIDLKVHNPNSFAVPTPSFAGTADLNNITVANWTANAVPLTTLAENGMIAPGETEELRFKVGLKNNKLDEWLESHVKRDEYTEADIMAHLIFEFEDKQFKVPAGGLKCQFNVQTDILVDNATSDFNDRGCEPVLKSYPGSESTSSSDTRSTGNYTGEGSGGLTGSELLN
ncbi:MAG: hypothetical protein ABEK04_00570 [Candidatus Nanohalobium sp.]